MYGSRLKLVRERIGLTQKQLADIIGVTRSAYTQYESEYNTIPLIHLITLCNYFDISLDYIFSFRDKNKYKNTNKEFDILKVGKRLKEFRKEFKITQVDLANIFNTTHSVIADYERGRYLISISFLYTICKNYHISADYLLGRIDKPKYLE